jgi:3-methyladenine DNA glycosylase AlkD
MLPSRKGKGRMEDLNKASVDASTLRDSAAQIAENVSQLANDKKFRMDSAAAEALDSAADHLAKAVENHLKEAAEQLATADSIVSKQEGDQAQLKRMPPG